MTALRSVKPDVTSFRQSPSADTFPGYPVALCCFDNADARRAGPLLMWYRPIFADRLTVPALDAHSGGPPDPDALVRPDHWVLVGLDDPPEGWGAPVWYRREPGPLAPFLPRRVIGRIQRGSGWAELTAAEYEACREALLARPTIRLRSR